MLLPPSFCQSLQWNGALWSALPWQRFWQATGRRQTTRALRLPRAAERGSARPASRPSGQSGDKSPHSKNGAGRVNPKPGRIEPSRLSSAIQPLHVLGNRPVRVHPWLNCRFSGDDSDPILLPKAAGRTAAAAETEWRRVAEPLLQGNDQKSKRQEAVGGDKRAEELSGGPASRSLGEGWFNDGWKGCSARSHSHSKRCSLRALILWWLAHHPPLRRGNNSISWRRLVLWLNRLRNSLSGADLRESEIISWP